MRTVRTASGATAVQTVYSSRRGSRQIEHVGSAHNEAELAALRIAAAVRLATGQAELDLDLKSDGDGSVDRPLEIGRCCVTRSGGSLKSFQWFDQMATVSSVKAPVTRSVGVVRP